MTEELTELWEKGSNAQVTSDGESDNFKEVLGKAIHIGKTKSDEIGKAASSQLSHEAGPWGRRPEEDEDQYRKRIYLQKVAETGDFDMRSLVGQAWARYLKVNKQEADKYKALGSMMTEKVAMRKKWAMEYTQAHKVGKSEVQKFQQVDVTKGTYMTFGALVVHYGGWNWQPAIDGG